MNLTLTNWYGRFSNNVVQLIRLIHYAQQHQFIPRYHYFLDMSKLPRYLINNPQIKVRSLTHKYLFYFSSKQSQHVPEDHPILEKDFYLTFYQYILPLIPVVSVDQFNLQNPNTLVIFIRSGKDIFHGTEDNYLQYPPSFIIQVAKHYTNTILISENPNINPCIEVLKQHLNLTHQSYNDFPLHLNILLQCQNLIISGFSTFPLLIAKVSPHLKHLYLPISDNITPKYSSLSRFQEQVKTHLFLFNNYPNQLNEAFQKGFLQDPNYPFQESNPIDHQDLMNPFPNILN